MILFIKPIKSKKILVKRFLKTISLRKYLPVWILKIIQEHKRKHKLLTILKSKVDQNIPKKKKRKKH
jgi:hypothetical protein